MVVLFSPGTRDFACYSIQTGCGEHPSSYSVGAGSAFPLGKVTLT